MRVTSALDWIVPGIVLVGTAWLPACGRSSTGPPHGLVYSQNPAVYARGVEINLNLAVWLGEISEFSVKPALPPGLSLDPLTGVISGTPTATKHDLDYEVKGTSSAGSTTVELNLTVVRPASFAVVANLSDDSLSTYLIDNASGELRQRVYTLRGPDEVFVRDIAVHRTGTPVYVANQLSSTLSIYDLEKTTGALLHRKTLQVGPNPQQILFDRKGEYLYLLTVDGEVETFAADDQGELTSLGTVHVGGGPQSMTIDRLSHFIWVLRTGMYDIQPLRIDPATHLPEIAGPAIDAHQSPIAMAVNRDNHFAYVVNLRSHDLLVFAVDSETGGLELRETVQVGKFPSDVTLDPTGRFLYVPDSGDDSIHSFRVDAKLGTIEPIGPPVMAGYRPVGLEIDQIGAHLYALNSNGNALSFYDIHPYTGELTPRNDQLTRDLPIVMKVLQGPDPLWPQARYAYVANGGSGDISIYTADSETGTLVSAFPNYFGGGAPSSVASDPRGRFLFTAHSGTNQAQSFQVDANTGDLSSTTAPLNLPAEPSVLVVEPSGRFVYVALSELDQVAALRVSQLDGGLSLIGLLPVDDGPCAIAVDPTGRFLFVAHRGTKIMRTYRIQPLDGTLVASGSTETVWGEPSSMVVHPSGRLLYVILRDTGEAVSFRIDAIDGSISSPIVQSAGLVPASISVDLRGRFAYTANSNPQGVGDLTHYQIDSVTGNLTFAESVATQLLPVSVQVGPSGRFLYVVNQGTDVVTIYGLDPMSGDLTLVGLPIPTGAMPTGIALIGWLE